MARDPLLEPFQLGHLSLRNRIVSTAHAPSFVEGGHPRDRYRLYHEEKAKGGIGLTIMGGSTNVSPDSPSVFGQAYAGDDSVIPWLASYAQGVQAHGSGAMIQLTHMGRRTVWDDGHWLPAIAPSPLRERAHRAFPKAMEAADIARVTQDFAAAAGRVAEAGFDGIELLVHSHLLGQFLSPLTNRREDGYGGSVENRMRLPLEVIAAVRAAVGRDMILGLRIAADEEQEEGLGPEDCIFIAQAFETTGAVDYLNVISCAPYDDLGLARWIAPMGTVSAPHLETVRRLKMAVSLPVMHAQGIADVATARHALESGAVDLVGMTRAHIADPHLVAKLRRGEEARIRPCVGLGYCVDRVNQGKPAVCGHSAATGREGHLPHVIAPAAKPRRAVVIGGGPAGMEAARVLASRGHSVTLHEAADRLGGQLRLAAAGRTRRNILGVIDWLAGEAEALGVDLKLNSYVEAEDVLAQAPDLVIVATGGMPNPAPCDGAALALSPWDVLSGAARLSGEVLVLDETGDHPGAVLADTLLQGGAKVTFVTPDRMAHHDLGPTVSAITLRDLYAQGIRYRTDTDCTGLARSGNRITATLRNVLTGATETVEADHVVAENGTEANDALYHALAKQSRNGGQIDMAAWVAGGPVLPLDPPAQGFDLVRVGDAVSSRNMAAAIHDALRICAHV